MSTPPRPSSPGVHHVAHACRDSESTHHFDEDLMAFRLQHTEIETFDDGGFFRPTFHDLGDGTCIAFDVHGVGEREGWSSEICKGNGLPVGVNHVELCRDTPGFEPDPEGARKLFAATERHAAEKVVSARAGVTPSTS